MPHDLTTLKRWENVVYYRTISPRHVEAAARRVCRVLFEGRYSDALEPMVHDIPLNKNLSNFEEEVERARDPQVKRELTENASWELIASGEWSYARLIKRVDGTLTQAGVGARPDEAADATVVPALSRGRSPRRSMRTLYWGSSSLLGWGRSIAFWAGSSR